jgi:hypothetical protein
MLGILAHSSCWLQEKIKRLIPNSEDKAWLLPKPVSGWGPDGEECGRHAGKCGDLHDGSGQGESNESLRSRIGLRQIGSLPGSLSFLDGNSRPPATASRRRNPWKCRTSSGTPRTMKWSRASPQDAAKSGFMVTAHLLNREALRTSAMGRRALSFPPTASLSMVEPPAR